MREIKARDELIYTTSSGFKYKFLITKIDLHRIHFDYFGISTRADSGTTHWYVGTMLHSIKKGSLVFCNKISIEDDPEYSGLFI